MAVVVTFCPITNNGHVIVPTVDLMKPHLFQRRSGLRCTLQKTAKNIPAKSERYSVWVWMDPWLLRPWSVFVRATPRVPDWAYAVPIIWREPLFAFLPRHSARHCEYRCCPS